MSAAGRRRSLQSVRSTVLARTALVVLAVSSALTGLPALLAPRTFFDDFPFVSAWVELLPPYNEHLVTDAGGFYCAFAVLFAWSVVRPSRALVVPVCVAWTVAAVAHLLFHVLHLDGFGVGDAIGQTVGLVLVATLPAVAVWACPRDAAPAPG